MNDNWQAYQLSDLIQIRHGFAFKGDNFSDEPTSDVLVTPGCFAIGGGFKAENPKYYRGPVPEDYVLQTGSLIVTMTDLSKAGDTLGYPAMVPDSAARYLHNQRIGLVRITKPEVLDKDFLYYLMRGAGYRHHILATATGSTVRHTSPDRIREFSVALPPYSEQRAIADVLKALDDKIDSNNETSRTLEHLVQVIFRAWFVDFAPVKAKAAGARYFASMQQEVFDTLPTSFVESELGLIPETWNVGVLGENCEINALSVRKGEIEGTIEYIDISAVTVGRLNGVQTLPYAQAPSRAKRRIRHGDTIWSCVRPNHRSYLFIYQPPENRIVSTGFAVLSPGAFGASFLNQVTTQAEFVDYLTANADGSAYPAVRPDHFARAPVIVPSDLLRQSFESITMPFRDLIALHDVENIKHATLRDYLLPKLLSGEVRVSDTFDIAKVELPR